MYKYRGNCLDRQIIQSIENGLDAVKKLLVIMTQSVTVSLPGGCCGEDYPVLPAVPKYCSERRMTVLRAAQ